VAERVRGKVVVEIGTRNGDGLACIAQTATKAYAIEAARPYCAKLRERSKTLVESGGRGFSVLCSRYQQSAMVDADVYTWWQQWPHLTDSKMLAYLRDRERSSAIRKDAVALFAVDLSWPADRRSWNALRQQATWMQRVPFNETATCVRRLRGRERSLCDTRAHGHFLLVQVPIAQLPAARLNALAPATSTPALPRWAQPAFAMPPPAAAAPSIAHIVAGAPYGTSVRKDGQVPSSNMLKLHLWAIASLPTRLAAVLVVLATSRSRRELPGYVDVAYESRALSCPLFVLRAPNNSLGSYGMYLHAAMYTRA
jgi:hypothetical protein